MVVDPGPGRGPVVPDDVGDALLEPAPLEGFEVVVDVVPYRVGHRGPVGPAVLPGRLGRGVVDRTVEVVDRRPAGDVGLCRHVRVVAELEVRQQYRREADGDHRRRDEHELAPVYAYQTHIVTSPPGVGTLARPVGAPAGRS